jgi:uncharacterized protein YxjI
MTSTVTAEHVRSRVRAAKRFGTVYPVASDRWLRTFHNMSYRLRLAQRLTLTKNVWEVTRTDGSQECPLGVIAQARMKLKEEVTCTTPDGAHTVFTIRGRRVMELGGTYDILDEQGAPIGYLAKNFKQSLGRSTYQVETPLGRWTVTETSAAQAILRRVVGLLSDIPWLLRVQFTILDEAQRPVGSVNRANMKIKDTYEITVEDDRLDMRVAAAIGVACDAFMNR